MLDSVQKDGESAEKVMRMLVMLCSRATWQGYIDGARDSYRDDEELPFEWETDDDIELMME